MPGNAKSGKAVFLGFLLSALILGIASRALDPFRSYLLTVILPPLSALDKAARLGAVKDIEALKLENAELKGKLMQDGVKLNEYIAIEEELGRSRSRPNTVVGYITAKRIDGFSNILIVDAGMSSGVRAGSLVESQGALLGYVKDLGENTALVETIWSPSFEVSGIASRLGVPLLFQGQGAGFLSARVPRDALLAKGDIIVKDMSNQLVIGEIVFEKIGDSSPLKEIIVRSPIGIDTLQRVFIHVD